MNHTRRTRRMGKGNFISGSIALLAGLALLAQTSCDTNARFNPNRISYDELRPVGAYPAVEVNGEWKRQCGGGNVDGLLFNMVLTSTVRKTIPGSTQDLDKDRSIRPGDVINAAEIDGPKAMDAKVTGTDSMDVTIDCIDPIPDSTASVTCEGSPAAAQLAGVSYNQFASGRRAGNDVVVLVDMSGSMKGFVDKDDNREYATQSAVDFPTDLTLVASDYHSWRLGLVREFIESLNSEDRFGVVAFGEGLGGDFMDTACALPEASGKPWNEALTSCFGITNQLYWEQGLDALQTKGQPGRSNLWDAVVKTYNFFRDRKELKRTNHILVITDGPDTCASGDDFGQCQTPCTSVGYEQVLQLVQADAENPNAAKIQIHFVQFESTGYPGSDARQMEIACESQGLYQFINSNSLSKINAQAFNDALKKAVFNVRFALMGYWQAALRSSSFAGNGAAPQGTPLGHLYALSGKVSLKGSSGLVKTDESYTFTHAGAGFEDLRPRIRKACATKVDCGAAPDADTNCTTICSAETRTCPNGSDGFAYSDGRTCEDNSGTCCDGTCGSSQQACPACSN